MTRKEVLNKIKEHKKEILIGAGATIGAGVLGYFGIKACSSIKAETLANAIPDFSVNDIDVKLDCCTVTEAWKEGEWTNFILNDFKAGDIGKLGAELIEKVPEVTEDTVLTCVLSTTTNE